MLELMWNIKAETHTRLVSTYQCKQLPRENHLIALSVFLHCTLIIGLIHANSHDM